MSDHFPTPQRGEDRVRDTLTALRADTERVGLSDASSVRRRGQARSRHQAVTGVAAAIVLVAAAVTGGTLLAGNNSATPQVPATQNPSPDDTNGQVTTSRSAFSFLLSAAQMPDRDFWGGFGAWTQLAPTDQPVTALDNSCFTAAVPTDLTAGAVREFRAGPATGGHAGLRQTVYKLPSNAAPGAAAAQLAAGLQACSDQHADDIGQQTEITDITGGQLFARSYTGLDHAKGQDFAAWGTADGFLVVLALEAPGIQDVPPAGGMESALTAALTGAQPDPTAAAQQLAADPFLRAGDMGEIGHYTSFQRSPDPVPANQRPLRCIASPTKLGADVTRSQAFYSDLDATFIEHVLRFSDAGSAAAALSVVSAQFAGCDQGNPADATVVDRPVEAVQGGDEAFRASRTTTPKAASEISYYELSVIRSGNVLVVLQWTSMGNPEEQSNGWVWTPDRLDLTAQRATSP